MPLEKALAAVLSDHTRFGQILVQRTGAGGFTLCHRDDENARDLKIFQKPDDALEIARYDDAGKYRPLKTAPNLCHGWRMEVIDLGELRRALDYFYPGRLAVLAAWTEDRLSPTPLRETLDRQSGMYRIAAKISNEQVDDVVGNFCKSDGGCLRTILWKRDARAAVPSTRLPPEKFDPTHDQTGRSENTLPLLCQEACNLLVAECRKVVKGETDE
ncbi:MAG TPA: DR2241 family protein [Chthoniobacterales bacterium]|nr:DR2241 family protein [Chthoniobacterales bacterium]